MLRKPLELKPPDTWVRLLNCRIGWVLPALLGNGVGRGVGSVELGNLPLDVRGAVEGPVPVAAVKARDRTTKSISPKLHDESATQETSTSEDPYLKILLTGQSTPDICIKGPHYAPVRIFVASIVTK